MAYDETLTDPSAIQSAMQANSDAYASADTATQQQLHADNMKYSGQTGQTYDSQTGTYSAPSNSGSFGFGGNNPGPSDGFIGGSSSSSGTGDAGTAQTSPTSVTSGSKVEPNVKTGTMDPIQPSKILPGYSYTHINDPAFLAKSPEERLAEFRSNPDLAQQEINRIKGVYSNTSDPNQQQNIHSWADQVRAAAGISNTDQLFGNAASAQADGSPNLSVNGTPQPKTNVFQGTSFESADKLAKELGVSYTRDPQTGIPVINGQKIYTYNVDANGNVVVPTKMVGNALGYDVAWDPKNGSVNITGGKKPDLPPPTTTSVTGTGTGTGSTGNGYNSPIQSISNGMPQQQQMTPWTPPDVSGFQHNMMPYQQFNPDINQYYQQAHNQLDPQFDAKNQHLMDLQGQQITKSDESMNRRGIFSSGIAQAAENDLRAKTSNAIANGFTSQMAQIEKVAQNLFNNAYKQYSQGNTFALKNNQDQITNMLNVEKQSFSQWAQTQKLDQSQYGYALKAWDQMAGMIMKDAQNQMSNNHFNETMSWNQYKFANPSAAQQLPYQYQTVNNAASNQSAMDRAMIPYTQGPTPFQNADLAIKQQAQQMSDYFKQQGINISAAHLEEAIRHDSATEGLTANGQAITSAHNQATEGLTARGQNITAAHNAATEANSAAALKETIQRDKAHAQDAIHSAKDADARSLLTSYNDQLHGVETELNRITTSGAYDLKDAGNIKILENLKSARQQIVDNMDAVAKGVANPPKGGGQ